MFVSPRFWKRPPGPRDDVFSLKMVKGILFLGIPGVIQCYQQLQVCFAHVNLLLLVELVLLPDAPPPIQEALNRQADVPLLFERGVQQIVHR